MTLVWVAACATKVVEPWHKFAFDGWSDKWYPAHELLEYSYGDRYRMVRASVITPDHPINVGKDKLPPSTGVNGPMPVGEFLFVKWRIKATGEVVEDRVDLRQRLPKDMTDHGLTFVIEGKQLYVFVITPTVRNSDLPPNKKTSSSRYRETLEIYPTNELSR
ncbi:MAG: hypothetical protein IH617_17885 [Hydrogenophaga sp.]|jgi:hypothetical protein|nr:hypothetical protein [Hydrogenophaga sp.]